MESIGRGTNYLDFRDWYKKTKKKNNIDDIDVEYDAYLEEFGVNKSFQKYLSSYMTGSALEELMTGIELITDSKTGDSKPLDNVDHLAQVLYKARNAFVHNARMMSFTNPRSFSPFFEKIGKDYYIFYISIETYIHSFEGSFINYWTKGYTGRMNNILSEAEAKSFRSAPSNFSTDENFPPSAKPE